MAFLKKMTLKHGADRPTAVTSAGSAIGGVPDGVEINIQQTTMTKQECLEAIDKLRGEIVKGPWPIP